MDTYNEMTGIERNAREYYRLIESCRSMANRFDVDYAEGLKDGTGFRVTNGELDHEMVTSLEFTVNRHYARKEGRWRGDDPEESFEIRSQVLGKVELSMLPVDIRDSIFDMYTSEMLRDDETELMICYEQCYVLSEHSDMEFECDMRITIDGYPVPLDAYPMDQSEEDDDEPSAAEEQLYELFEEDELLELLQAGEEGFVDEDQIDILGMFQHYNTEAQTASRQEHLQRIKRLVAELQPQVSRIPFSS